MVIDGWNLVEAAMLADADDDGRFAVVRRYAETCDPRDGDHSYDYETRATKIATRWPSLVAPCDRIATTGEEEREGFRFLCVAIALNGYRRERHASRARALIDSVESIYGDIPLFLHFRAMSMQGSAIDDLRIGLAWAEAAHRLLPANAGITHTCAVFIADLADVGALLDPDERRVELSRGLSLAEEAIRAFPKRGRFYHTRARLRRLEHDYTGARADLARAIDMEPRDDIDSRERIATYLIERSLVDSDQAVRGLIDEAQAATAELVTQTDSLRRNLAESQIQIVEVIGFVAAVLGLVLMTANAFEGRPVAEAIALLAGMAIVLFGAVALGSWMLRRSIG